MTLYDLTSITDERNASKTPELLVTKNYSAGIFIYLFFNKFLCNDVQKCFPLFQDLRSRLG